MVALAVSIGRLAFGLAAFRSTTFAGFALRPVVCIYNPSLLLPRFLGRPAHNLVETLVVSARHEVVHKVEQFLVLNIRVVFDLQQLSVELIYRNVQ